MRKISKQDAEQIPVQDLPGVITSGIEIIEAAAPVIKTLFQRISEWVKTLGKNNPDSPHNVRLRLKALEAKDELQKLKNKEYDQDILDLKQQVADLLAALNAEPATTETTETPAAETTQAEPAKAVSEIANKVLLYNGSERKAVPANNKAEIERLLTKGGFRRIDPGFWNRLKAIEVQKQAEKQADQE